MLEQSERIKSSMVDKYMASLNFFREIYSDILADEADDSYNALHRTVPILITLLDDTAGAGKQLDLVIAEVENSTRSDFDVPDGKAVGDEDASHYVSRVLIDIRGEMQEMLSRLNEQFSQFVEASFSGIIKTASTDGEEFEYDGPDGNDIGAELVKHYVTESCKACGMAAPRIEDATESCEDMTVLVRGEDGKKVIVVIGSDLTFRGVYPASSNSYASYDHYREMFRPALSTIGHIRPVGEDFIIFCKYPQSDTVSDGDVYAAYDIEKHEPVVARIVVSGGKKTKSPSYSIVSEPMMAKAASYDSRTNTTVNDNAVAILESPMVKVQIPGSQYDGMAGVVDASRMVTRNDHVEFPVMLEYDTGLKTEVWVTDDDVVTYGG